MLTVILARISSSGYVNCIVNLFHVHTKRDRKRREKGEMR
jgi:hypothetical protein